MNKTDPLGLYVTDADLYRADWVIVDDVRTGGCPTCNASHNADEPPMHRLGGWNARAFAEASIGAAAGFGIDPRMIYAIFLIESNDWSSNYQLNGVQQTARSGSFGPINMHRSMLDAWQNEPWFSDWVIKENRGEAPEDSIADAAEYFIVNSGDHRGFVAGVVGWTIQKYVGFVERYAADRSIEIVSPSVARDRSLFGASGVDLWLMSSLIGRMYNGAVPDYPKAEESLNWIIQSGQR